MQNLILTPVSVPELVDLIASEVEARINRLEYKDPPLDRISLNEATEITGLQKSALYKMTMVGTIPHEKFGRRLVFSRQTLQEWVQSRTITKISPKAIMAKRLAGVNKNRM